ncbi:class I SAM-dependent methyltransferase [Actinomycetes bacterium M1A6_2h]
MSNERALSFGQVADEYDRWRPGYPAELFSDMVTEGTRVLEAGAGTGKATAALVRAGASVLAVEPDPQMAELIRSRCAGGDVEVQVSTVENCVVPKSSFDVVSAAQSWHWVDPVRGAAVAARALRPGGALCVFGNRLRDIDGPVWAAVNEVYAEYAPELDRRVEIEVHSKFEQDLARAEDFSPWTVTNYEWTAHYDADSFAGLLGTFSNHIALPPSTREPLLRAVRAAVADSAEGQIDYHYVTVLATAHVR